VLRGAVNCFIEMEPGAESESTLFFPALSKRAARRLIQRAFVLAGRDKRLREHIREAHLTTLWVLEDWNFAWTVALNRGRIEFERRPAKKPDLTLTWGSAAEFFHQVERSPVAESDFQVSGRQELRRFSEAVLKAFFKTLGCVLRNPVDDAGESLL
jgi:hypothetical protein